MAEESKSIYDCPLYYDILFGWDRDAEAEFYDAAFCTHGSRRGGDLIEIACGTGQIAIRLAKLGWRVTGLDMSTAMLEFFEDAAMKAGVTIHTICADMRDFTPVQPFDGAYCPLSSFRLLPNDRKALGHLRAMAYALHTGGIYILDMGFAEHIVPDAQCSVDRWSMTRGNITVSAEGDVIRVEDTENGVTTALGWGKSPLREYTSDSFSRLVEAGSAFAIQAWYPVARTAEGGIDIFDVRCYSMPPVIGRAMVALRRL